MSAFNGLGALAVVGQNPIPQGTPDELRKLGVNLDKVASCAPRSPGVHGCPVYKDCPFGLLRMGGFKDHGPKYIGFYQRTHEGNQREDFMLCHNFTRVMLSRMRQGRVQAEDGIANAEIIRVISQEGGFVRQRLAVPVNPNDHNINAAYEKKTLRVEVPKWPRPGEVQQSNYDLDLWQDEMARQNADPDFATAPAEIEDDDEVLEMDEAPVPAKPKGAVVAEPVKGGK